MEVLCTYQLAPSMTIINTHMHFTVKCWVFLTMEKLATQSVVITVFIPTIPFKVMNVCEWFAFLTCGNTGISWRLSIRQLCEKATAFWIHILLQVYLPSGTCCLPSTCAIKVSQKDHEKLWWQSSMLHIQIRTWWAALPKCHNATGKSSMSLTQLPYGYIVNKSLGKQGCLIQLASVVANNCDLLRVSPKWLKVSISLCRSWA